MSWFSPVYNFFSNMFGSKPSTTPVVVEPSSPTPLPPTPITPTVVVVPTSPIVVPTVIVKKAKGNCISVIDGINKYQMPGNNLNGCVDDAIDTQTLLQKYNFNPSNTTFLADSDATTSNITNALKDMLKRSSSGDELVWYHSSHGTRMALPDSGVEDDFLVTYDFDWDSPNNLSGHLIGQILTDLKPGVDCTIIVDACHSGTVTRNFGREYRLRKFLPPPAHILTRSKNKNFPIRRAFHKDLIQNQGYLLLAGCADDQTSEELQLGTQVRGIFTYSLNNSIRKHGDKNWSFVFNDAKTQMAYGNYEQTPQFSGDRYLTKQPFIA